MPAESAQSSRLSWPGVSVSIALAVCALIVWGYLRSWAGAFSSPQHQVRTNVAKSGIVDDARSKSTIADAPEVTIPPARGRLIETLRQQVARSPVLQDSDAQTSLFDALDQAGDIWTKAQRQNRDALHQLNRQVRLGESRAAPSLVLITFERGPDASDVESPRQALFTRLSERGVSFAQHHAGGESPESGWWTLMTGRNPGHAPQRRERFQLSESDVTLPTALWKAGYKTALLGLWTDRTDPLACGFDEWTGQHEGQDEVTLYPRQMSSARRKMTIPANSTEQRVSLWQLLETEITSFLKGQHESSRPFFLLVRLPELKEHDAAYSAESMVEYLLEELKEAGLDQQTCVFVTALAGSQSSPLLSARQLQVPLVMVGGSAQNVGRVTTDPTVAWDLLPTFLDIAQAAKRPSNIDGISLVAESFHAERNRERLLYWESDDGESVQAVRRGEWFGTAARNDRMLRLYHLPSDAWQEKDVASDHPEVVKRLLAPTAAPSH